MTQASDFILYLGSGPEDPSYPIHLWTPQSGRISSFRWDSERRALSLSASREGNEVIAAEYAGRQAALSLTPINDDTARPRLLFGAQGSALYYPKLSPTGSRIAYLITPGVFYPPKRNAQTEIRILERQNDTWLQIETLAKARLSPFDWGTDDSALVFTNEQGSLSEIALSRPTPAKEVAPLGSLPCYSPDRSRFAYYRDRDIVIRTGTEQSTYPIGSPIEHLCWTLAGDALIFSSRSGPVATTVKRLSVSDGHMITLFETVVINSLTVLSALPNWPRFKESA